LYLDLKGTSATPLSVAEAMAYVIHAYHPGEPLPASDAALCGRYQSVLYGQRALVLLDNAASREQVEPLLPPSSCVLLVTSRQYFTLPGLHAVRLTTLRPPDACTFVQTIVPRVGEQADRLAALCGYLPLALRVSASTLADHLDLSPHDYVQRLTATQQRLSLIDASLSVSFALLPPALQQQWCLVALFPSLFDAEAAATVLELETVLAQDVLSRLVRASLVEWAPETGRYRLHDLARVFAQARLERTRERAPLDWARTQHILGRALGALGERDGGTARLEEAVQAYRAALQEYTRERAPLEWARTQTALGSALSILGWRAGGPARLEEAVQVCQAALQEYHPRACPPRLGTDAAYARLCTERAGGAGRRHRTFGRSRPGVPGRPPGAHPRACPPRLGADAASPGLCATGIRGAKARCCPPVCSPRKSYRCLEGFR
jgi:hypothetical protein